MTLSTRKVGLVVVLSLGTLGACARTGGVTELYEDTGAVDTIEEVYNPDVTDRELVVATPSALSFGNLDAGDVSCLPFTLTNQGNVPVTVSAFALAGDDAFSWSLAPPTAPVTLAVEAQVEHTVCVTVPGDGVFTGEVQISWGAETLVIPLHVESHAPDTPCLVVEPLLLDLGPVAVDTLAQDTVTLRSCSRAAQTTIEAVDYEGDDGLIPDSFPTPFILEVGDEVPYSVTFAPRTHGEQRGTVTFRTQNQSIYLELTAEGIVPPPPEP